MDTDSPKNAHFEWTPEMSVGESTIDAQHQRLLAQLNKTVDAMLYGPDSKEVADAVTFFKRYVDEHLAYEEDYMARRGYPDIEDHKQKHEDFRKKYQEFHDKLVGGLAPVELLTELEVYLGDWWVGHINHEDRKYYESLGPAVVE